MNVEQLMTRDVITVAPETPLKEVAGLLVEHRISGVPVCDPDGGVVGVVSEADVLRLEEGFDPWPRGILAWIARCLDGGLERHDARTAGDAMTSPALTIRPTQPAADAACLMVERRVNRLPVVIGRRLVGIVSRGDLMRAFARSDEEVAREIREDVLLHLMLLPPADFEVTVRDGHVSIAGEVAVREDVDLLLRLVRRVPGVVDIHSNVRPLSAVR
jgi:CBS domain-containing protein